jgi:two-component system, OmpR family, sensor histidine kinase SenX3
VSPIRREHATPTSLEHALADAVGEAAETSEQRDRLLAVLGELGDGVIILDAAGQEMFRNPAAERYREARHADAVVANAIDTLVGRALAGERCERELQVFGPPRAVVHLTAVPLGSPERTLGAVAFVSDVSDAHRVESVRRDFVANVSHELKTPIGALEVLAETLASETDPAVTRPLAERMVKEADRLARIVDDLLDLSLIESQEAPNRTPVPLEVLVDDAVDRLRPMAAAGGIDLRCSADVHDVVLVCDRRQVVSAIANLIDNAVKYSEPGGLVTVDVSVDNHQFVLTVNDSGIGIPRGDLERIFERFYRVDQARSRDTGGTGLGLAIVRHVARAHGGDVTVDSTEGQGSTFRLVMPVEADVSTSGAPVRNETV